MVRKNVSPTLEEKIKEFRFRLYKKSSFSIVCESGDNSDTNKDEVDYF